MVTVLQMWNWLKNMGCKAILLQDNMDILKEKELESYCVLVTTDWDKVAEFLFCRRTYSGGPSYYEGNGYLYQLKFRWQRKV